MLIRNVAVCLLLVLGSLLSACTVDLKLFGQTELGSQDPGSGVPAPDQPESGAWSFINSSVLLKPSQDSWSASTLSAAATRSDGKIWLAGKFADIHTPGAKLHNAIAIHTGTGALNTDFAVGPTTLPVSDLIEISANSLSLIPKHAQSFHRLSLYDGTGRVLSSSDLPATTSFKTAMHARLQNHSGITRILVTHAQDSSSPYSKKGLTALNSTLQIDSSFMTNLSGIADLTMQATSGGDDRIPAVEVGSDGSIFLAGNRVSRDLGGGTSSCIVKIDSSGQHVPTFAGPAGPCSVTVPERAQMHYLDRSLGDDVLIVPFGLLANPAILNATTGAEIAALPDVMAVVHVDSAAEKFYAVRFSGVLAYEMVRYNHDGTQDLTFPAVEVAQDWSAFEQIRSYVLTADSVYIGGLFTSVLGTPKVGLARISLAGGLHAQQPPDVDGSVYQLRRSKFDPDRIYVTGAFTVNTGAAEPVRRGLALLRADGTIDTSLPAQPMAAHSPTAIASTADDGVLVVGSFNYMDGVTLNKVARFQANGLADLAFNTQLDATLNPARANAKSVHVLKFDHDANPATAEIEKYLFCGKNLYGTSDLVLLNSDGTVDAGFAAKVAAEPSHLNREELSCAVTETETGYRILASDRGVSSGLYVSILNELGDLILDRPLTDTAQNTLLGSASFPVIPAGFIDPGMPVTCQASLPNKNHEVALVCIRIVFNMTTSEILAQLHVRLIDELLQDSGVNSFTLNTTTISSPHVDEDGSVLMPYASGTPYSLLPLMTHFSRFTNGTEVSLLNEVPAPVQQLLPVNEELQLAPIMDLTGKTSGLWLRRKQP